MAKRDDAAASGYVAVVGFDHDPWKSKSRVEAGEPVPAGLPEKTLKDLIAQGVVEKAGR